MRTSEETFVNRFVIHPVGVKRWKTYRLIATRADLQSLVQELSAALGKDSPEGREDENGTRHSPLWSVAATEAYARTDRTLFEIAIAEDLAPYHECKRKLKDRAVILLLIALGVVFVVGALTIGYFALKGIDWLLFSHHRV